MSALLPLLLTAAGLLALSGTTKLRDPGPAAAALAVPTIVVRAAAVVEVVVAGSIVARPAAGAVAAAGLYLGFAALVAVQLHAGATRSCGCLGAAQTPPSRAHVAVDVALAAVCAASAVATPAPLAALAHPVGVVVWIAAALVAALELTPQALAAYRRPGA
jgi:hypothetical protein